MEYLLSSAVGYLLGSVNPAYLIGRLKGFDIREKGTGNAGASNAKLVMGWPYFFICAGYDILKAIIAYGIVNLIYPGDRMLCVIAGCGAVIGHCLPFYLGFKGGKGFASFIGLSFVINPKVAVIVLVCGLAFALPLKYIVIATFNQFIAFPVYMIVSGQYPPQMCAAVVITVVICLYKHRINIVRFLSKQEINTDGRHIGINILNEKENKDVG